MSLDVFPSLAGLGFDWHREEMWRNLVQENVSGKETRAGLWSYPRHRWTLTYEVLPSAATNFDAVEDDAWQQLVAFFNLRQGTLDSFRFLDPDDNAVVGQGIGAGDGVTVDFQLVRTMSGFVEPISAPNTVDHVYVDAVEVFDYAIDQETGIVTLEAAPNVGEVVTADFSYYFHARFVDDTMDFMKFARSLWSADAVKIISIKKT